MSFGLGRGLIASPGVTSALLRVRVVRPDSGYRPVEQSWSSERKQSWGGAVLQCVRLAGPLWQQLRLSW
jgi:hypothetical protein